MAAPSPCPSPAAAPPFVHDWGAPGIREPPIQPPTFNGTPSANPLPFHGLQFHPLGLFELRRRLGIYAEDPSIWNTYRERFLAADIAWIAHGASDDNQHVPEQAGFFPEFFRLRESLPSDDAGYDTRRDFREAVKKSIWDLTTMLDRTFGSTTMILHAPGTTVPGTPPQPDFLRASVYLPPAFLRRHPEVQQPIAQLVQSFIESVAVPTARDWGTDARLIGWHLPTRSGRVRANNIPVNLMIPRPTPASSSHYLFRGRPAGAIVGETARSESPESTLYGSEEPLSRDAEALIGALEQISLLESEVKLLSEHLDQRLKYHQSTMAELIAAQHEANKLSLQLASANARVLGYEEQHRELQAFCGGLQDQLAAMQRAPALRGPFSPRPHPPSYTASSPQTSEGLMKERPSPPPNHGIRP
ncbi:hypothetical protein DFH06DRAFT_1326694 [Mycena polygramma]|nr:hypothetical protein DFH06DRAFT_1326694 [Mycena polygramma]